MQKSNLASFFIREPFQTPHGGRGFSHKNWVRIWGGRQVMNAISRMSPPQFGHSSGNSPTRAISFAQAIRDVSCERGLSVAWFASQQPSAACVLPACPPAAASRRLPTLPFRECRDGSPELVIRRKYPVVAMAMFPRRRHEIGEPVQELKRREFDDAIGPRPRGRSAAAGPDPGGGFVPRQHVADAGNPAGWAADHGESLECEGRPGAVSEKVLKTLKIARHIAVDERDPDARVH